MENLIEHSQFYEGQLVLYRKSDGVYWLDRIDYSNDKPFDVRLVDSSGGLGRKQFAVNASAIYPFWVQLGLRVKIGSVTGLVKRVSTQYISVDLESPLPGKNLSGISREEIVMQKKKTIKKSKTKGYYVPQILVYTADKILEFTAQDAAEKFQIIGYEPGYAPV
jgi:hypothetical protein